MKHISSSNSSYKDREKKLSCSTFSTLLPYRCTYNNETTTIESTNNLEMELPDKDP
jgi:hypothetical protein